MTKLICILGAGLLCLTASFAQGRLSIGVGLSTSFNGCGEIAVEHGFCEKWAVSISAGFKIGLTGSLTSEETISHHQEFGGNVIQEYKSISSHKESFVFSYWPAGIREGPSLSFGAEYLDMEGFDAIFGICYRILIWRKLHADICYHIRCITPILYGSGHKGTAGLKLYYRF